MNTVKETDIRIGNWFSHNGNWNYAEHKVGDVGYFWGIPLTFVYYGILIDIITKNGIEYVTSTGIYTNFSKTPPELK